MGLQFDAKTGLPLQLYCGAWEKPAGHLQGIAMDDEGRYMYYSFTDRLIKADMRTGEIVGSVTGLLAGGIYGGGAHMGCLAYHDGRVYGSLEYKAAEKFYVAVFDCAAITRMDMDYKTPGVMTAMYMDEVVRDYVCDLSAGEHNNAPDSMGHRFGCSGIDGITFGPVPGEADKGVRMLLSYGIYGNTARQDNDYQVVLAFDPKDFAAEPFDQNHPHTVGPRLDRKFFVYTGNTTYGVQNLEYDRDTGDYWMIVYEGKKPQFPNGPVYLVDGAVAPVWQTLRLGDDPEYAGMRGEVLALRHAGVLHEASGVWYLPNRPDKADTGFISLGEDTFYAATNAKLEDKQTGTVRLLHLNRQDYSFAPVNGIEN